MHVSIHRRGTVSLCIMCKILYVSYITESFASSFRVLLLWVPLVATEMGFSEGALIKFTPVVDVILRTRILQFEWHLSYFIMNGTGRIPWDPICFFFKVNFIDSDKTIHYMISLIAKQHETSLSELIQGACTSALVAPTGWRYIFRAFRLLD